MLLKVVLVALARAVREGAIRAGAEELRFLAGVPGDLVDTGRVAKMHLNELFFLEVSDVEAVCVGDVGEELSRRDKGSAIADLIADS